MTSIELSKQLIGHKINHKNYGSGQVKNVYMSNGSYYITILFTLHDITKSFLVSTAFSSNSLSFDNNSLNDAVLSLIDDTNDVASKQIPDTINEAADISSNETTNRFIDKIINGEAIALDLIAQYDDRAYQEELYGEAFLYLEKIMQGSHLSLAHKACIVCALSLIALKYYDGDLHSHIEAYYRKYRPDTEHRFARSQIERGVRTVTAPFRAHTKYFDMNSFVAVPIIFCCVPHYKLIDLFKISYAIYKQKLLYDEDLNDTQIYEKVLETFDALKRKDLISDSETIKGTNYLMSKYTQSCIYSGFGIGALSQIVTHCIRLIISYLTLPEDAVIIEPYYQDGFSAWSTVFNEDENEKTRYEANRTISQPYLKLIDNYVHLFTGEFSMDDCYDPNNVHICIYNGDSLIEDKLITDPNSIEYVDDNSAMGGFVIHRQKLLIPRDPLGEISYSLISDGHHLYDSKTRLFRSSLFFDGKGNEIRPGSNYNGVVFAVTRKSNKEEFGDRIIEDYYGDGYIISIIEINDQEVFYFDNEPFIFYKVTSASLISYQIPWVEFDTVEGKTYPIYDTIVILFPSSYTRNELCVEIDGVQHYYDYYDHSGIHFTIRHFSKEAGGMWVYSVKIYGLDAGFHNIRIINSTLGKQIKDANFSFIYDPEIWKGYSYKDDLGIYYDLSGSFIDDQTLLFEYGTEQVVLRTFVKNLGYGDFIIFPSSISYSIDGDNWFDIDKKIYLCEIPEETKALQVCGPRKMSAYYVDDSSTIENLVLNFAQAGGCSTKYNLYLSFFRTLSQKTKAIISFEFGNRTKHTTIWFNPFVLRDECDFHYDELSGSHTFKIIYEGDSKVKATIKDPYSDRTFASETIESGAVIEIKDDDLDSSVNYLSVALYGKKYGSLFDSFNSEPFMCFPKYDLGRKPIRLEPFPPPFRTINGKLSGNVHFENADTVMAQIIPSGFDSPIYSKIIESGAVISKDVSSYPFNSYTLCLYSPDSKEPGTYNERPFYCSSPLRIRSPFLHQTFTISSYILNDGEVRKIRQSIRFNSIEEIDNKYYMIASIMEYPSGKIIDGFAVSIKEASIWNYKMSIRRRTNGRLLPVRLSNGKVLENIVVDKKED